MSSIILSFGELLSIKSNKYELKLFNTLSVIDALDTDASSIVRYNSRKIMYLKQSVFKENVIKNIDVFKLSNIDSSPIFVSQKFVDLWVSSGLSGLDFILRII